MTLGAARVIWNLVDLSLFVDEVIKGYVFMVLQTERGDVGSPKIISSLDQYRREFGRKVPWTTDPLVAEMALRQGGRLIISRACHYEYVEDPSTITALCSTLTIKDRGNIPLPAKVTAAPGSYTFRQALSGRVTGTETGPFTFGTGASDAFKVKIGSHDAETVTLSGSQISAQEVVDQINAGTAHLTASASNNKIKIVADTITDGVEIQTVANDAYSVLGLLEAVYAADAGTDTLIVKVGSGGSNQTFKLLPIHAEEANFALTAAQVAMQLHTLTDAVASVVAGALRLSSVGTGGSAAIQIISSSTADTPLGMDNTSHAGSSGSSVDTLKFTAANPGAWGNSLKIQISDSARYPDTLFNVKVIYGLQGDLTETYVDLSMDSTDAQYVVNYINERSLLVTVEDKASINPAPASRPIVDLYGTALVDGDDGGAMTDSDWIGDPVAQTGIYSCDQNFYMSMDLMIPGTTSVTVYQAMIAYCLDRQDMIAYGQTPFGMTPEETVNWRMGNAPWTHPAFDSHRFALYFGRPKVYDDMDDTRKFVPWLGQLASCLAKTDNQYGPQYAPAGAKRGTVTLMEDIDFNVQGYRSTGWADLFAESGINYLFISHMPGIEGGMFWEQRTTLRQASALRNLNVIRFLTVVYRSLMPMLRTFLFDPNHPVTWREIHRILEPAFQAWKDNYSIYDFAIQTDRDAYFDGGRLMNAVLNSGLDMARGIYHCRGLIQPTEAIYYLEFDLGVMNPGDAFENYTSLKQLPGWVRQ